MSRTAKTEFPCVTPAEVKRRLEEYRRQGFERQAIPHIVYLAVNHLCPWPGCGFAIAGIDFQLEKMQDAVLYSQALAAWWQGPGLVGRCPGCHQWVLFSMDGKQTVNDPPADDLVVLPDDWHEHAFLI